MLPILLYVTLVTSRIIGPFLCCYLLYLIINLVGTVVQSLNLVFGVIKKLLNIPVFEPSDEIKPF